MSDEARHVRALMRLSLVAAGVAVVLGAPTSALAGAYGYSENDVGLSIAGATASDDPYDLNEILSVDGPDTKRYAPGPGTFKISYRGSPGQIFDASASWNELVTVSVPEPSAIVLLGLGLAIVCSARRLAHAR